LKKPVLFLLLFIAFTSQAQLRFSFTTDVSVLRNFSPRQKFWSVGQNVRADLHLAPKETFTASLAYFSPVRFHNYFDAPAKLQTTNPSTIVYLIDANWRFTEISLGWKHYFHGDFEDEETYHIYSLVGFGIMPTRAENLLASTPDTSRYMLLPTPVQGKGRFTRLTLDLGAGGEYPLGANFFLYTELKTWLSASSYHSPYLHSTKNFPLPVIASFGMRVLFGE
jgi:hypothetical protein